MGIVEFEKKGRIKRVTLTEPGADIALHLEGMVKKFLKLESGTKRPSTKAKKGKK